jgi:pyrroloquinoline quinone biosynthesis protein B
MRIIVLGAGAGGGVPQWNANNRISSAAFRASPAVPRLTQTSVAISADGEGWVLINASPDIRQQIIATPALHPRAPVLRTSPIEAVILTNADVDAVAGLLTLRERQPFTLYASPYVHQTLRRSAIFDVLDEELVRRMAIAADRPFHPAPGLQVTPLEAPGKPPLYAEGAEGHEVRPGDGMAFGFLVEDRESGKKAAIVPACGEVTPALKAQIAAADALFFDGTLFTDDEMLKSGEGKKTARRMGHIPMTGPGGAVETFRGVNVRSKFFIHVNNTNPALMLGSFERRELEAAGWGLAEDGMELIL